MSRPFPERRPPSGWPSTGAPILAAVLVAACGPGAPAARGPEPAVEAPPFEPVVDATLRKLAAIDRRLAERAHVEPSDADLRALSMDVILREDTTAALVGGALDPFSFAARRRALEAVRESVTRAPARSADGATKERLLRLVREELAREEEERALPGSASVLVSAIARTWTPTGAPDRIAERDAWLARRLAEIDTAVARAPLLEPASSELDDALDAVENGIKNDPYRKATIALTRLRGRLEAARTRGEPTPWEPIARGLRTHVGEDVPPRDALDRRLGAIQRRLREAIHARRAAVDDAGVRAADDVAARSLFQDSGCAYPGAASLLGRFGAPPERAPGCALVVRLAASAAGDVLANLEALHDHVAVARWALDVDAGPRRSSHPFVSGVTMPQGARLMRLAAVRPVVAIGAGLVVEALVGADTTHASEVAARWSKVGDAPLDVVLREIFPAERAGGLPFQNGT